MGVGLDEISVSALPKVGPALLGKLEKLGIRTLMDLLFHLPFRYEDRAHIWPLGAVVKGSTIQGQGQVINSQVLFGKRRSLEVVVEDATGRMTLRFYHFNLRQQKQFEVGAEIRFFGEVRAGRNGVEMYHPEYQVKIGENWPPITEALTPVYPLTEGVSQSRLRATIKSALKSLRMSPPQEYLTKATLDRFNFPDIVESLTLLHAPGLDVDLSALTAGRHPAQARFIFEELMAHHFSLILFRHSMRSNRADKVDLAYKSFKLYPCAGSSNPLHRVICELPFTLTRAQQKVIGEILFDLTEPHPMMRLVQGDVGSGKTIVAALAALAVIHNNAQVVVMAPTEILAEQHRLQFEHWLSPLNIEVGWLSGKTRTKARNELLDRLANGAVKLVIGTHALFQEDVRFHRLALVIVDEQHRFGVHQRLALKGKAGDGRTPHQLIMTATPIPRTLAMSAYADLDTSVIDELPSGRKEVVTAVVNGNKRAEVIQRVNQACREGKQAYWVCTLIEESETLQAQAAETTYAALVEALPLLKIGLIHGRLKPADKAEVMARFKEGILDLLVATTVIEVGVDVPNASLIIIENPERLGLAQLHQLRGRVGRGSQESYCLLMYSAPLSENGKARLAAMKETNSGFEIAEKDLEIRGPGEMLGTRQTGLMQFKLANLERDAGWLELVREEAPVYLPFSSTVRGIMQRWVGQKIVYAEV